MRQHSRWAVGASGVLIPLVLSTLASPLAGAKVSPSPVAVVRSAALKTVRQGTAIIKVKGTSVLKGISLTVSGTGAIDFTHHLATITTLTSKGTVSLSETEVISGATIDLSILENGVSIVETVSKKPWVQITESNGGASASSLLVQFQELSTPGVLVSALGKSSVDGQTATGYRVTVPASVTAALAAKRLLGLHLTASQRATILKSFLHGGAQRQNIWVNQAGLIVAETVSMSLGVTGQGVQSSAIETFSHFGDPVSIHTPAPGLAVPYHTFLTDAQKLLG